MHNQVKTLCSKQFFDPRAIANIQRGVREALCRALQSFQVPQRVPRGTEEFAAHIVIDAENVMTEGIKMPHRFGAD